MKQDYQPKLDDELFSRIMAEIDCQQKKAEYRKAVFFSATFFLAFLAVAPAFNLLKANIIASGLSDYLSLLFSDYSTILKYWDNFALSLLEALPVMSLAAFLAVIFVLLESMKHLVADFPTLRMKLKYLK